VGEVTDKTPWLDAVQERVAHFILPVFCLTYGSLAYLSRQMRGGVLSVFKQDYIRTARAKGLSEGKVVWKHAFRNSLIPIITIFASLFPAAISGAFIIEIIFSLPGMGKVAYLSLQARDYPMVFAVMMFSALLTLVGTLVSDILYAVVDPRISFDK
jgi:peptide/nickel transport system permease protein